MTRNLGALWLGCLAAAVCAVACAVWAARLYQPPSLLGFSGSNVWREGDFLASLGSSLLALGVGIVAGRAAERARAFASLVGRVLVWFALTVLLVGIWGQFVYLFTLLIAPTHSFAALRLWLLWRSYRSDLAWRR